MKRSRRINIAIYLTFFMFINLLMRFPLSAEELELGLTESKAHYTIEVVKQIEWPNENVLTKFVIGIAGYERGLKKAFEERASINIRGKTLVVEDFDESAFKAGRYSIVFLTQNKRSLNSLLFSQAKNQLIIVDGRTKTEERMVSFITTRERIRIKLNRENLSQHGFLISANLLQFAGTKEDLSEELKERESSLKLMLAQVKEREVALALLNQKLQENTLLLNNAKRELSENTELLADNQAQLKRLKSEIDNSQSEVRQNEKEITEQQKLLSVKQNEMAIKEQEVAQLQRDIDQNNKTLNEQNLRITQQKDTIENRDETIDVQRNWMQVILLISIVFFVMIYVLLKTNSLRRKANRELKQLNNKLYELATTDGLTELYNRRYFLEAAQKELLREKRKQSHAVLLMIDIDHFKQVNDTYGHPMGDEVIRTVADILRGGMRQYDIVGRLGGEEYAMMLMDCDLSQGSDIAKRLCAQVADKNIDCDEISIKVTISIGLTQLDIDDTKIEQTIMRADKALYQAKDGGRNRVMAL